MPFLQHASLTLRGDRDIIMAAVAQNGCALRFATDDLRGDQDIAFIAVSNAGSALQDADEVLYTNWKT